VRSSASTGQFQSDFSTYVDSWRRDLKAQNVELFSHEGVVHMMVGVMRTVTKLEQ
jgi:hypothetical protein